MSVRVRVEPPLPQGDGDQGDPLPAAHGTSHSVASDDTGYGHGV